MQTKFAEFSVHKIFVLFSCKLKKINERISVKNINKKRRKNIKNTKIQSLKLPKFAQTFQLYYSIISVSQHGKNLHFIPLIVINGVEKKTEFSPSIEIHSLTYEICSSK